MDIIQGLSWVSMFLPSFMLGTCTPVNSWVSSILELTSTMQNRGELRKKRPDGYLEDPPSLPEQYLAPSWSWASILGQKVLFEGQIQFDHIKPFAKLMDVQLDFATGDRFGALTGGSITLRAPLVVLDCESVIGGATGQSTSRFPTLMKIIHARFRGPRGSDNNEYRQKHQGYPRQRFCILQLLQCRLSHQTNVSICLLLLESVQGGDSWRRLTNLPLIIKNNLSPEVAVDNVAAMREIQPELKRQLVKII